MRKVLSLRKLVEFAVIVNRDPDAAWDLIEQARAPETEKLTLMGWVLGRMEIMEANGVDFG